MAYTSRGFLFEECSANGWIEKYDKELSRPYGQTIFVWICGLLSLPYLVLKVVCLDFLKV
jgi:hypothetical protein